MKSIARTSVLLGRSRWLALLVSAMGLLAPWKTAAESSGSFSVMTTPLPNGFTPGHMLLLPDGRVMVQQTGNFGTTNNSLPGGNVWQFLLPDNQGHYIDGTWSNCQSMNYTREYYSSDILTNGQVFVAGGEYGTGGATAETFDAQANGGTGAWTIITPPTSLLNPTQQSPALLNGKQGFIDSESVILPDGNVLVAPVGPNVQGGTLIYNPTANNWVAGPLTQSVYQDECSWVKLPDNSILTVDPNSSLTERYIPSLNTWIPDQSTAVYLWASNQEIGAALLLANGTAMFVGGNGASAIYTPSGNTNMGSWVAGPNLPSGMEMRDAPSAILVNGKVLLAMGTTSGDSPFTIYEYDPNNQSFTSVFTDNKAITDKTSMLDLPDGTVLFNDTTAVYVFQPDGSPLGAGQPAIQSVSYNSDGSLHITGTLFNGISQGAMYGDDAQQDSNFPLVSFSNGSGNTFYGRSYNWSSTSVMTGNQVESTEVALPAGVLDAPGNYSIQVIANGNASAPVSYYGPVWVNFNYSGSPQNGEYPTPYETLSRCRRR
jgi:hypothetical protein